MNRYSPAAAAPGAPTVSVRMYQVGFGDCFLLSLDYPAPVDGRAERHLLVDFGRNTRPLLGGGDMAAVARSIAERCHGKLDVVVISHRHEDHLSGFGSDASGRIIEDLAPDLVVRPWTEEPGAAEDAGHPLAAQPGPGRYLRGLAAGQGLAEAVAGGRFAAEHTVAGRALVHEAANQIPNRAAIDRLDRMADGEKGEYLRFGDETRIGQLIPGLEAAVLGPPTPDIWPAVRSQREDDPEYWLRLAGQLPAAIGLGAAPEGRVDDTDAGPPGSDLAEMGEIGEMGDLGEIGEIGPARWLVERVRRQQVRSILRIVRWLDRSINNTSLILLLRIGERRLLFPGDAQIEDWSYALTGAPDRTDILDELALVDIYKVGHHGSRNATPKTLYRRWGPTDGSVRPIRSLMSTRDGVYGEKDGTRVPNGKLVAALGRGDMRLFSTRQPPAGEAFVELQGASAGPAAFEATLTRS